MAAVVSVSPPKPTVRMMQSAGLANSAPLERWVARSAGTKPRETKESCTGPEHDGHGIHRLDLEVVLRDFVKHVHNIMHFLTGDHQFESDHSREARMPSCLSGCGRTGGRYFGMSALIRFFMGRVLAAFLMASRYAIGSKVSLSSADMWVNIATDLACFPPL